MGAVNPVWSGEEAISRGVSAFLSYGCFSYGSAWATALVGKQLEQELEELDRVSYESACYSMYYIVVLADMTSGSVVGNPALSVVVESSDSDHRSSGYD